jgi:multidrug efflux pump subunit AcrB
MTLGGVAAAIGLVIDDAIVVVENIYTHLARGQSRREAVERAISEITIPIIGSTITPVVVFLPLTLLTGVTGVFFRSLALTMSVALLTSLVLALSFTPVLAERFVKVRRRDQKNPVEDEATTTEQNAASEMQAGDREEDEEGGRFLRPGAIGFLPAIPKSRFRLSAGVRRGCVHPRLHRAARHVARRNRPDTPARRADVERGAGH